MFALFLKKEVYAFEAFRNGFSFVWRLFLSSEFVLSISRHLLAHYDCHAIIELRGHATNVT
jgi:hypothetical protein